jgi:hypothetical protein
MILGGLYPGLSELENLRSKEAEGKNFCKPTEFDKLMTNIKFLPPLPINFKVITFLNFKFCFFPLSDSLKCL